MVFKILSFFIEWFIVMKKNDCARCLTQSVIYCKMVYDFLKIVYGHNHRLMLFIHETIIYYRKPLNSTLELITLQFI